MSITVTQKKRGRPATGETPQIGVRFSAFQLAGIEAYAEHEGVSRSDAIRQLIDIALVAAATYDDPEHNRLTRIDNWRDQDERMASRPNAVGLLLDYGLEHLEPSRSDD